MNLYSKELEAKLAKEAKSYEVWKLFQLIEQQSRIYTLLHNRKPDTLELRRYELDLLLFYVNEQGYNVADFASDEYYFGNMKIVIK